MTRRVVQTADGKITPIDEVGPAHPARMANPGVIARNEAAERAEQVIERRYLPTPAEAQAHLRRDAAAHASMRAVLRARERRGRSTAIADLLGFFYGQTVAA